MRLFATLFFLFLSIYIFAQTPSTNYYGDPPTGQGTSDFISLGEGVYNVYGTGFFDGHSDRDICVFSVEESGNPTMPIYWAEEKNQSIVFVEPIPGNRHVVCSSTIIADQIFNDIKLTIFDADGTEIISTFIDGAYSDFISHYAVDENGNIYLVARFDTDLYNLLPDQFVVAKYTADLTEVYYLEQDVFADRIESITLLPDGQLALFRSDFDGNISGFLLSESGDILWSQEYEFETSGIREFAKSVFDGTNIELLLPNLQSFWTIDITDGSRISESDFPINFPFVSFGSQFVYHADSYWLFDFSIIYKIRKEGNNYMLETEYFLPGGSIDAFHPDSENTLMLLTSLDELIRFDIGSGTFTTVSEIEIEEGSSFLERVDELDFSDNELVLGLSHDAGFDQQFSLVRATDAGELIEKIVVNPEGPFLIGYDIISIADDKVSLLTSAQGVVEVSFWNTDGSLRSSMQLNDPSEIFITFVEGLTLDDGRIIGMGFYSNPGGIQFYEIDTVNETFEALGSFPIEFSIFPAFIHPLEGEHIGFIEFSSSSTFRSLKVDINGQISWENTYELEEGISRNLPAYGEWAVNPAGDTYVIGHITNGGGVPPYYDMKLLDTDGNLIREFRSDNSFVDATAIFSSNEEITVIGTDYNLFNQMDGEQYLLYYQRYDLMGNLLFERVNEVPYPMYFHRLRFLPNGNLALMGRASIDASIDAAFIIMDEQGTITKVSTLSPAWGQLQLGPNPGRDHLQLKLDNEYQGPLQISLIDSKGQRLRSWTATKATASWAWQQTLGELPAGTYWVNISSPEGQVTQAWLKQ